MNNLITVFGKSDNGIDLIGFGLTDKMIDHLKKTGGVLEPDSRTKMGVDLFVVYAPTDEELLAQFNEMLEGKNVQVKNI